MNPLDSKFMEHHSNDLWSTPSSNLCQIVQKGVTSGYTDQLPLRILSSCSPASAERTTDWTRAPTLAAKGLTSVFWSRFPNAWLTSRCFASSARTYSSNERILRCPSGICQYLIAISGADSLSHAGRWPFSRSSIAFEYVITASSSRYPTKRWQICGDMRYARENPLKNTHWAPRTMKRIDRPGSASLRKVRRCIRSLYASSRSVSILLSVRSLLGPWVCLELCSTAYHPLSLRILRMLFRCRSIPATIPGTPATLSKKMNLVIHFSSVMMVLLERLPFVDWGR